MNTYRSPAARNDKNSRPQGCLSSLRPRFLGSWRVIDQEARPYVPSFHQHRDHDALDSFDIFSSLRHICGLTLWRRLDRLRRQTWCDTTRTCITPTHIYEIFCEPESGRMSCLKGDDGIHTRGHASRFKAQLAQSAHTSIKEVGRTLGFKFVPSDRGQ